MKASLNLKLLFIINPGSGNNEPDWPKLIRDYFKPLTHTIELFYLPDPCDPEKIKQKINEYKPERVVAVGGDGTVKLAAQCLLKTCIPLGILPAGSANGMAKELEIPKNEEEALDLILNGETKKIHIIKINDELCIHLSDIGFNAFVVKKFETDHIRGMWGYMKATWKVLWNHPMMQVKIQTDNIVIKKNAAMIVIANATKYGTGALINPNGKLYDNVFEVIVIKKISVKEIFKMMVTHTPYDPEKTEIFQTSSLHIQSKKKVHFQVDGEYLGKVNNISATILLNAIEVIIPETPISTLNKKLV
ncbi:MAG: diacylglycerol kinase family lipid kinase [Bacteroidota bacterium]|nr:diacylglycerol kinase family lipid kinase [Bacteroidota bacterium]